MQNRWRGSVSGNLPGPEEYKSLDEQLAILKSRGLTVPYESRAIHYLKIIGYHRLRAYFQRYYLIDQRSNSVIKKFESGTTFNDVIKLYVIDRELRLLLLGPLEKIEVALRSLVIEYLGNETGDSHTINLMDTNNFILERNRSKNLYNKVGNSCIAEIRRIAGVSGRRPDFYRDESEAREFVQQYSSWHILHNLSFGKLSMLIAILRPDIARGISMNFNLSRKVLISALKSLNDTRNRCAHHEPIWFPTIHKMVFPGDYNDSVFPTESHPRDRLYTSCAMIHLLLGSISENSTWSVRLKPLVHRFDDKAQKRLGFPQDWEEYPFWGMTSVGLDISNI